MSLSVSRVGFWPSETRLTVRGCFNRALGTCGDCGGVDHFSLQVGNFHPESKRSPEPSTASKLPKKIDRFKPKRTCDHCHHKATGQSLPSRSHRGGGLLFGGRRSFVPSCLTRARQPNRLARAFVVFLDHLRVHRLLSLRAYRLIRGTSA